MKIEWNKLTARERDAKVAELVMGWKWGAYKRPDDSCQSGRILFSKNKTTWVRPAKKSKRLAEDWDYHVPEYTSKLSDAFEVVEKLESEFQFYLHTTCDKGLWDVVVEKLMSLRKPVATVVGVPLPEAICIAALRAKGHEVIL